MLFNDGLPGKCSLTVVLVSLAFSWLCVPVSLQLLSVQIEVPSGGGAKVIASALSYLECLAGDARLQLFGHS